MPVVAAGREGRPATHRLPLAFGPVRMYVTGLSGDGPELSVDVPAAAAVVWGILDDERAVDMMESVSSGALVFRSTAEDAGDFSLPGTIFVRRLRDPDAHAYLLAHERVHVVQYDQSFLLWGDPVESWLGSRYGWLDRPLRHLEFNLASLGAAMVGAALIWPDHGDRLWEREASYLGRAR